MNKPKITTTVDSEGIAHVTIEPPKALSIADTLKLIKSITTFNAINKIDSVEMVANRNFDTMQTLAIIAEDAEAFKKLNVSEIVNYHNKALMLVISTDKYKGRIFIVNNASDYYDVWNTDGAVTCQMLKDIDCYQIQQKIIEFYAG